MAAFLLIGLTLFRAFSRKARSVSGHGRRSWMKKVLTHCP